MKSATIVTTKSGSQYRVSRRYGDTLWVTEHCRPEKRYYAQARWFGIPASSVIKTETEAI